MRYPSSYVLQKDRFDDMYLPEPNTGCWLWLGPHDQLGYGRLNLGNRKHQASHRFSFERAFGPIPPGSSVLHRCDTPACVNPAHLWLGTQLDNMRDMGAKGRKRVWGSAVTHCKSGHALFGDNVYKTKPSRTHGPQRVCRACKRAEWHRRENRRKSSLLPPTPAGTSFQSLQ